jgi:hypothetical protein
VKKFQKLEKKGFGTSGIPTFLLLQIEFVSVKCFRNSYFLLLPGQTN